MLKACTIHASMHAHARKSLLLLRQRVDPLSMTDIKSEHTRGGANIALVRQSSILGKTQVALYACDKMGLEER